MPVIMDSVKDWVMNKCKVVLNDESNARYFTKVVTPNNIPVFTIPRTSSVEQKSNRDLKTDLDGCGSSTHSSTSDSLQSLSPSRSPTHAPVGGFLLLPSNSFKHARSAPVTPSFSPLKRFDDDFSISSEDVINVDNTNADPQSLAAMGLAHFKTKTSFGFDTLKQTPHTRRKESLFHAFAVTESESQGITLQAASRRNFSSCDTVRIGLSISDHGETESEKQPKLKRSLSRRRNVQSLVSPLAMLTTPVVTSKSVELSTFHSISPSHSWSTHSSPVGTPCENKRPSFEGLVRRASSRGQGEPNQRQNSMYRRRRSSLPGLSDDNKRSSSFRLNVHGKSVSEIGTESSRRHSHTAFIENDINNKGNLPCEVFMDCKNSQTSICTSCSCHSLPGANPLAEFGEIKFSLLYIPQKSQLRLLLIRAENLKSGIKDEHSISSFAKVCLMPGKIQQQASRIVRNSCDPVYDEEFYFRDIDVKQFESTRLRIKFMNKFHNFRRPDFLGEVQVPLKEYDLLQEQRMWKNIEKKTENGELGFIQLRLCFEPKSEKLLVSVGEISGLPKLKLHDISDIYIRIEILQPGRNTEKTKRQTAVKRKCSNPIFDQTYIFKVSPRIEDLNYTSVIFTVCSHERIRHDQVIGQIKLGVGATEETELQHWSLAIQNPEQEFTETHRIMEPDEE